MSQLQIDQILAQIRALSGQAQAPAAPSATAQSSPSAFSSLLQTEIEQVSRSQEHANDLATAFEKGTPGVELPQVMVELQKASLSFRALTEARNRLISAYQEIMQMQM